MEAESGNFCYYFAYGSNMNPRRMQERGTRFIKRELGKLLGHLLVLNKRIKSTGTAAANVVSDESSVVYGALYTCPNDHVLTQLDKYEGVLSNQYYRHKVSIILSNGASVNANIYVAHSHTCSSDLKVHPSYLQHLLEGKDILPPNYFDFLCSLRKQLLPDVPSYHYFAYGSDVNPREIQRRGAIYSKRELGCLSGFKISFNKIKKSNGLSVANISPCEGTSVFGAVYTFYDSDPFENLDSFHGVKTKQYSRSKVTVGLSDGQSIESIAYIASDDVCREGLRIDSGHFDNLLAGEDILPPDYFEYLISFKRSTEQGQPA